MHAACGISIVGGRRRGGGASRLLRLAPRLRVDCRLPLTALFAQMRLVCVLECSVVCTHVAAANATGVSSADVIVKLVHRRVHVLLEPDLLLLQLELLLL